MSCIPTVVNSIFGSGSIYEGGLLFCVCLSIYQGGLLFCVELSIYEGGLLFCMALSVTPLPVTHHLRGCSDSSSGRRRIHPLPDTRW